jgi:hypothetical protein
VGLPGGVALGPEKRLLDHWCVDESLLREVLRIEKRRLRIEKAIQ